MPTQQQLDAKQEALDYFQSQQAFAPATIEQVAPIVGVGIGEDSLRVYATETETQDIEIPSSFNNINTDVVATPGFNASISCGVSVGHVAITAGTLGCLVQDPARRHRYILSNNHVLANCNNAAIGNNIVQPGPADGGFAPRDTIAKLSDFVKLGIHNVNFVDAAIAELCDINSVTPIIQSVGYPAAATVPAMVGMHVHKHGRTTGYTVGSVLGVSVSVSVNYAGLGVLTFDDQIEIFDPNAPFGQPGDSGSLVLEQSYNNPVGLLFAVDAMGRTLANPIDDVLNRLRVVL